MRRSSRIAGPALVLVGFYTLLAAVLWLLFNVVPGAAPYMPFGGIDDLLRTGSADFEVVTSGAAGAAASQGFDAIRLSIALVGGVLLMVPVCWVYFITTPDKRLDRSFAQTMVVLPVVVAGVAVIVHNSLALAFSLAGIVAAVRFRFSLTEPAHALYIFMAIVVGLGAGVSALGISIVASVAFVLINLVLWRMDFGDDLTTPFFSFLTGRGQDDHEL